MAFRGPLLGYNTNVRHKGKLYHIQTEDSGVDHPHVITHLFADGGRILASKKTSYAERVGNDGLPEIVKKLMQAQHKAMFIALRDGVYDEEGTGEERLDRTGTRALPPAPEKVPAGVEARADLEGAGSREPVLELALDPGADLHESASGPALESGVARAEAAEPPSPAPGPKVATFPKPGIPKPPPAKNDGAAKAAEARSLFGGDLLSDRSLDEVILNYLAANESEG